MKVLQEVPEGARVEQVAALWQQQQLSQCQVVVAEVGLWQVLQPEHQGLRSI